MTNSPVPCKLIWAYKNKLSQKALSMLANICSRQAIAWVGGIGVTGQAGRRPEFAPRTLGTLVRRSNS